MPRRSSSSSSTSRSATASRIAPPKQTQASQPARSGMAGGLMGSLMSGMAFGAGAEFFRQLFRNPTTGEFMMPLIISGLSAWGTHRFLLKPSPYKGLYTAAVFGGTFLFTKKALSSSDEGYEH